MRKVFPGLFIFLILLTGCSKEKYFTCKINKDNEIQNYTLNAVYKVYYEKSYVTKVEKKEVYKTQNEDTLDYFYEYKNLEYVNLNNLYGGFTHEVKKNEDEVKLNATIDMSLVDIKKMKKDKYISSYYIVSNKLTTGGIKNIYEEKGAICDI